MQSKYKKYNSIPLFCMFFCFLMTPIHASEELYVAGIPSDYPLEYYDKKSESYQGIITEMLREAAQNAGFSITYIGPTNKDNRLSLAKKLQVDIICAMNISDEQLSEASLTRGSDLLTYQEQGETIRISFAYTSSIAENDKARLEEELQKLDKDELLQAIMKTSAMEKEDDTVVFIYHRMLPILSSLMLLALLAMPFILQKKRKQIEEITFIDDETGQYNYAMWKQKFKEHVKPENCRHYAILYLQAGMESISQIYGFKEASDAVSLISNTCVPLVDNKVEGITRFNEYNFIFFVRYTTERELKQRVEHMHQVLKETFVVEKKRYFLELHTGIYQFTNEHLDLNTVLQYSKVAMEYAKIHYLSTATYDESIEKETISGYLMEHEAIHGLMQEEFIMYLQPLQDLKTGTICGAETLVRWQNPVRGLLKPKDFFDVMKRKNLTGKMNMEIYRQGCRMLKEEAQKEKYPSLLFNFSVENFADEKFADDIFAIAQQYGVNTKQMIIQLNQLVEISESKLFIVTIKKLREYGYEVCLSGLELDKVFLEYLKYDVNYIKLRRELLQNAEDPKGQILLRSIVNLCHELELNIICVGVEKVEQATMLEELHCEMATGFYYYYPVSKEVFRELL